MAAEVRALLLDAEAAHEEGLDGHRAVAETYGWDRCLAPLLARLAA
jgi:hypothetical protein